MWIRSEGLGVELYHTLKGHTDAVTAICEIDYEVNISQHSDTEVERHLIISGGKNGELKLWKLRISNLPESYCVRTINLGDEVLALHRAGEFLLCALRNRKLVIFDVKSIEFICEVYPHSGDVLVPLSIYFPQKLLIDDEF